MSKKIKSYNLSKDVIANINNRAEADGRKDSDWLNRYLTKALLTPESKPKAELVKPEPKFNFKNELLALGADKEKADDWMVVRKNKKASNTKTALAGFLTEVNKAGISVAEAVKIAAESSWSGFKANWYANSVKDSNKGKDILQLSAESNWEEGINEIF